MYYWETKEMCGYESKLQAALRQIYLHAQEGENVVLRFEAKADPSPLVYPCDLDSFGECPKDCKDCKSCKPL